MRFSRRRGRAAPIRGGRGITNARGFRQDARRPLTLFPPMRLPVLSILVVASLACGCAHERGWSGEGATPFDAAQADCDAKTRDLDAGKRREEAFDACMAGHGWKRP